MKTKIIDKLLWFDDTDLCIWMHEGILGYIKFAIAYIYFLPFRLFV